MLFAHLERHLDMKPLRLRGLQGAVEELRPYCHNPKLEASRQAQIWVAAPEPIVCGYTPTLGRLGRKGRTSTLRNANSAYEPSDFFTSIGRLGDMSKAVPIGTSVSTRDVPKTGQPTCMQHQ